MKILWTEKELDFIRDNYPSKGCAFVARELNRTQLSVEKQAHRIGIYRDRGLIDLTGRAFGKWTVLSKGGKISGGNTYWLCRCECGTEKEVQRSSLVYGKSKKCQSCAIRENSDMKLCGKIPAFYIRSIEKRSARKGIPYNLDSDYLNILLENQGMRCAISGVPLNIKERSDDKSSASLDRIVPALGYTKGNVQWVHRDVNYMKGTIPIDRFLLLCEIISRYQTERNGIEIVRSWKGE